MGSDQPAATIEQTVKRSTKASGVPEKVKDKRTLLDLARLLKR